MEQKIKNIFKLAIHFLALIFFIFPGFVRGILYWYFRFYFLSGPVRKALIFRQSWAGQRGKYFCLIEINIGSQSSFNSKSIDIF